MSLKQEIETWVDALSLYDDQDLDAALIKFGEISDTSKILFNCGLIHATQGEHGKALEYYQRATELDKYLAIAYFQQGVSNFIIGDFKEALANFNDALKWLRGNRDINYDQLGLKFKLHACEVLFNRGLCLMHIHQEEAGMNDLSFAVREKAVLDHDVIEDAIRDRAEGYTVFSIPVGLLFRPNEAKVRNLGTRYYMSEARLVARRQEEQHQQRRQNGDHGTQLSTHELDLSQQTDGSWAAANLVTHGLRSRPRQAMQSPTRRLALPPTPPPESEKPHTAKTYTSNISKQRGKRELPQIDTSNMVPPSSPCSRVDSAVTADSKPCMPSHESSNPAEVSGAGSDPAKKQNAVLLFGARPCTPENIQTVYKRHSRTPTSMRHDNHPESIDEEPETETGSYSPAPGSTRIERAKPSLDRMSPHGSRKESDRFASLSHPQSENLANAIAIAGRRRGGSFTHGRASSINRAAATEPVVNRIKIKLHAGDEIRFAMLDSRASFVEVQEMLRLKTGLEHGLKVRMRDEVGDMVTLADEEDWDMAVEFARQAGRDNRLRSGSACDVTWDDMDKLELWLTIA